MYIHFYVGFCFWRERWIFEHVEDLIQFETQNVFYFVIDWYKIKSALLCK